MINLLCLLHRESFTTRVKEPRVTPVVTGKDKDRHVIGFLFYCLDYVW